MGAELKFGSIFKSSMRKARVHHGLRYAFGGLITELRKHAGVLEEPLDYFSHIESPHHNVTNIKGLVVFEGPVVTTTERAHRDELIMGWMYGLEMLRHRTGGKPFTQEKIDKVKSLYPLNAYVDVVLEIDPQFFEPVENDVPIDPKNAREASNIDDNEIELDEPPVSVGVNLFYQPRWTMSEHFTSIPQVSYA